MYKTPVSVLVVIHTPDLRCLLLERAAHPGFWQSVTGSREGEESLLETARREVFEETGFTAGDGELLAWNLKNSFQIMSLWKHRYAPDVSHNTEHVLSFCLPSPVQPKLAEAEHRAARWLDWREAAKACFSWTNRDAILMLADRQRAGSTPETATANPAAL
jgi:dihydroneopterin triphosphate diphosphatase